MMTSLKLWKSPDKALPNTVMVDGRAFEINPSHRNILKIIEIIEDTEIAEPHKPIMIAKYFFVSNVPLGDWSDALSDFIACGKSEQGQKQEKAFDFSEDSDEIFSSFLMLYNINLFKIDLHWFEFSALLSGAFKCNCPLSEKIRIRTINPEKCENKTEARRAKEALRIKGRISIEEEIETAKLIKSLR